MSTQIEEGDLFDFDREVQPILDVLVGSVLQQALREFSDEEELRLIRIARDKVAAPCCRASGSPSLRGGRASQKSRDCQAPG